MDLKDFIKPIVHVTADAIQESRCREPVDLHTFGPRTIVKLAWRAFWHRHREFQRRLHRGVLFLRRIGVPIGLIRYEPCTRNHPWWIPVVIAGATARLVTMLGEALPGGLPTLKEGGFPKLPSLKDQRGSNG